jgi:HSP20 family protein
MTLTKRNNGIFPSHVEEMLDPNYLIPSLFSSNFLKTGKLIPQTNIVEEEKEFKIELSVPGLKKDDFKIEVENGTLTVSCEKEEENTDKEKRYRVREYSYNSFSRSFQLPENVKEENINAKYEDGVLCLTVPKKELTTSKPKKAIKVS